MRIGDMSGAASVIRPEDRVIELCPTDALVARSLAQHGFRRYLALTDDAALSQVRADAGALADRVYPLPTATSLQAVGVDVLILNGRAARMLWMPHELPDVRVVAAPAQSREARFAARLGARGRLRPLGIGVIGERRHQFFEVIVKRPPSARVYLSPVIGHSGLLDLLNEAGVRAVVLRWFDDLPHVEPGEDVDLLVADEYVDKVRAIITEEPGTLPVDVYSVSGLPGSDREGLACYPPDLARRIIDRAVRHPSGAWVPAPDDHLFSLAHHAVYHKGAASGLPSTTIGRLDGIEPEHDYPTILANLAAELDIEAPADIEGWDEYLARAGWRPPMDTLRRLSAKNEWIHRRFFPEPAAVADGPELTAFILRRRALDVVGSDEVRSLMDHLGFEILHEQLLSEEAASRCAAQLRGGNWGRGPYPMSGGTPAKLMVALHYGPVPVEPDIRTRYPHLTNRDVLTAKEALRDLVNERLPPSQHCNPVHSSDNEEEAWEYLAIAVPDEVNRISTLVERRRTDYKTPDPVIGTLRHGRRAKVELVNFNGELAVRKTYGHPYVRNLEREVEVTEALGGHDAIPAILARGTNWIVRPYIEDRLQYVEGRPTLIPLNVLREMVRILRELHDAGFAVIDAKPDNFLLDDNGLKLIDFEFAYRYPGPPPPFHQSYTWHSPKGELAVDLPVGPLSYEHTWYRWTGMPIEDLCYATFTRQRYLRARYRLERVARSVARLVRRGPNRFGGFLRRASAGIRNRGRSKYKAWARTRAQTVRSAS